MAERNNITCPNGCVKKFWTKEKIVGAAVGGGLLALGSVVAAPLALAAVGFTSGGIASGSIAAGMMSLSASASGGGVAAGGLVAGLQSAGAIGLGAAATAGVAAGGGAVGTAAGLTGAALAEKLRKKANDGGLDDKTTSCVVCEKNRVCIMFEPCGHICTCRQCSSDMEECPQCKSKIDNKQCIYLMN